MTDRCRKCEKKFAPGEHRNDIYYKATAIGFSAFLGKSACQVWCDKCAKTLAHPEK